MEKLTWLFICVIIASCSTSTGGNEVVSGTGIYTGDADVYMDEDFPPGNFGFVQFISIDQGENHINTDSILVVETSAVGNSIRNQDTLDITAVKHNNGHFYIEEFNIHN